MIKKIVAILVLVLVFSSAAFGIQGFSDKKYSIGIDLPFFGWLQRNNSGQIEANLGINLGLGISYKRYFAPLRIQEINPFWAVGTLGVIYPYIGLGIEYVWPEGWYLGGGGLIVSGYWPDAGFAPGPNRPIGLAGFPEIHGGYMF